MHTHLSEATVSVSLIGETMRQSETVRECYRYRGLPLLGLPLPHPHHHPLPAGLQPLSEVSPALLCRSVWSGAQYPVLLPLPAGREAAGRPPRQPGQLQPTVRPQSGGPVQARHRGGAAPAHLGRRLTRPRPLGAPSVQPPALSMQKRPMSIPTLSRAFYLYVSKLSQ